MNKKRIWLFTCMLSLCLILFGMGVRAAKPEDVSLDHPCRIEVQLENSDGEAFELKDREIHLMRIAGLKVDGEELTFEPEGAFKGADLDLSKIESESTAEKVYAYSQKHPNEEVTAVSDENGKAVFDSGISSGLYLVTVVRGKDDVIFSPFLLALPKEDGNDWNYYLIATPKAMRVRAENTKRSITVKKLWNDNGRNRPVSIVIELIQNGDPYTEVTLSEANGWTHTWDGLPAKDHWWVREKEVPNGYVVTYREENGVFYVSNNGNLLQTGQSVWPIWTCICTGVIFLGIGALFLKKGRDLGKKAPEDGE